MSLAGYGLLVGVLAAAAAAQAQPATENVEVDPITCWWRTTTSAVRTGEPFGLTLTCMVVETEATRVVPDQSRLDASVVQLPPFEVLGGSHPGDLRTPGKRFFQYEYRLRVIAEEAFGADIMVPALEITYRIESRVSSGDSVQGRDLTYALPRASIRVISLVPDDTSDIREAPAAAFAGIEARASRASLFRTIATVLFALAGVVAVVVLFGLVRRRSGRSTAARLRLNDRAILRGVSRELAAVKRESQGGWTPELVGRTLAAFRIAASYAIGATVGQLASDSQVAATDGQLRVGGRLGRAGALVSGAATAESVASSGANVPGVEDGLRALTALRYGRTMPADDRAAEALDTASRLANQQLSEHSLRAEWSAALMRSLTDARKRVWA